MFPLQVTVVLSRITGYINVNQALCVSVVLIEVSSCLGELL